MLEISCDIGVTIKPPYSFWGAVPQDPLLQRFSSIVYLDRQYRKYQWCAMLNYMLNINTPHWHCTFELQLHDVFIVKTGHYFAPSLRLYLILSPLSQNLRPWHISTHTRTCTCICIASCSRSSDKCWWVISWFTPEHVNAVSSAYCLIMIVITCT